MMIRRLALAVALSLCLAGLVSGCGPDKTSKAWTEAPPPSNPNAQREMKPGKIRPPAPPSVGAPGGGATKGP